MADPEAEVQPPSPAWSTLIPGTCENKEERQSGQISETKIDLGRWEDESEEVKSKVGPSRDQVISQIG